jgi:16S rRNA (cytidine1402-2'-O)-methyltransferase
MGTQFGKLFVVATPIGNLSDITLRALKILKSSNLILAEDTRKSGILLKHYEIDTPMKSYRDQNHERVFPKILALLQQGNNIALVSDSGTPLISDPGFRLVKELRENNIEIESIPGPSALVAALSISGLPTDNFTFLGFLPKGSGKREKILSTFDPACSLLGRAGRLLPSTLIIYESPFRILKLLETILKTLGNRKIFIANELTKKFEKTWSGDAKLLISKFETLKCKGEFVVLVAKKDF